jgi:hypothetical protein
MGFSDPAPPAALRVALEILEREVNQVLPPYWLMLSLGEKIGVSRLVLTRPSWITFESNERLFPSRPCTTLIGSLTSTRRMAPLLAVILADNVPSIVPLSS